MRFTFRAEHVDHVTCFIRAVAALCEQINDEPGTITFETFEGGVFEVRTHGSLDSPRRAFVCCEFRSFLKFAHCIEVEFESSLQLEQLRSEMRTIDGGEMMVETLSPASEK